MSSVSHRCFFTVLVLTVLVYDRDLSVRPTSSSHLPTPFPYWETVCSSVLDPFPQLSPDPFCQSKSSLVTTPELRGTSNRPTLETPLMSPLYGSVVSSPVPSFHRSDPKSRPFDPPTSTVRVSLTVLHPHLTNIRLSFTQTGCL